MSCPVVVTTQTGHIPRFEANLASKLFGTLASHNGTQTVECVLRLAPRHQHRRHQFSFFLLVLYSLHSFSLCVFDPTGSNVSICMAYDL